MYLKTASKLIHPEQGCSNKLSLRVTYSKRRFFEGGLFHSPFHEFNSIHFFFIQL